MSEKAFKIICEESGQPWPNGRGRHYPYEQTERLMDAYISVGDEETARQVARYDIRQVRADHSLWATHHQSEIDAVILRHELEKARSDKVPASVYRRLDRAEALLRRCLSGEAGPTAETAAQLYFTTQMKPLDEGCMHIYVVCSVRDADEGRTAEVEKYVKYLEDQGHKVHFPQRDVNQADETGINIVRPHRKAMREADRVDIFWDVNSKGSHFDIGMAFMAEAPIHVVMAYQNDTDGKSYYKVMKIWEAEGA